MTGRRIGLPSRSAVEVGRAERSLPDVDMGRLVGDISRTFNPLASGFELDAHARQLPGGLVEVSVVLPAGMTRAFVGLLDSLAGLVRFVSRTTAAGLHPVRPLHR